MLDNHVAAALCAITAFADVAAFKASEEFLAFGHVHILLFPQGERAHRRGGITSAVLAVAITHLQRITAHLDLYRSAITCACMLLGHRLFDMAQIRQGLQDFVAHSPRYRSSAAARAAASMSRWI